MTADRSGEFLLVGAALMVYPNATILAVGSRRRQPRIRPGSMSATHRRATAIGLGIAAVGVLLGMPWWIVLPVAVLVSLLSRRVPVHPDARARSAAWVALAAHADLLAVCLDSGMSVGAALTAVCKDDPRVGLGRAAGDGPDGMPSGGSAAGAEALQALRSVAALCELGADPATAWQPADDHPDLARLAAAARRSAEGGTTFADAVREHAQDLRDRVAADQQRRASRAGVAMVGPLAVCFLPAFVCLGLVPVVIGLVGTLGLGR